MSELNSKDLIDEICLIELITPDVIIKQIEDRYNYGYTINDYLTNVTIPPLARMDLERRLRDDRVNGMKIVGEMREKGQRYMRITLRYLIVLFGVIYLLSVYV
jgi:hypothetical protein